VGPCVKQVKEKKVRVKKVLRPTIATGLQWQKKKGKTLATEQLNGKREKTAIGGVAEEKKKILIPHLTGVGIWRS